MTSDGTQIQIFANWPNCPCHGFCIWHGPIGKDLDLSFIWDHHHLSEYMDISRPADYFIACHTVLMRPNKVETAVYGCNCWLSVWTLSRRWPVKLFKQYQRCIIVCYFFFWLIRSFTDPAFTGSIFVCGPLHHHVSLSIIFIHGGSCNSAMDGPKPGWERRKVGRRVSNPTP